MGYVDGFIIAVPNSAREAFIEHARHTDSLFMKHGATRILECWGDDVPAGKVTDFRRAVQAAEDETVVFSWVEWPDKATRDAALPRIMQDPAMNADNRIMPFDGKRMVYGGFVPVVKLGSDIVEQVSG